MSDTPRQMMVAGRSDEVDPADPQLQPQLNEDERQQLDRLESIIQTAHRYMLQMARALWTIREHRLYRNDHRTFEEYCQYRWSFTGEQGRRLCQWVEVTQNLMEGDQPIGGTVPLRESHARPLACLTPDQQRTAWRQYLLTTPDSHSAKAIQQVCEEVARAPVGGNFTANMTPNMATASEVSAHEPLSSPLSWYGGKAVLAQKIVEMLPKHHGYVEVFFGSGSVFFRKPPSPVELLNDRDAEVVSFFRVLRDAKQATELQKLLRLTPFSRDEHDWCRAHPETDDPVERARRFFVRCRQSFASIVDEAWSHSVKQNRADSVVQPIESLLQVTERLLGVQIENKDFRALLPTCDRRGVVCFCDPPYLHDSRQRTRAYGHEMTKADHADLLGLLTAFKSAKVILCGYRSDLYDRHLQGWRRYEVPVYVRATTCPQGARQEQERRTECLWTNY